MWQLCCIYKEGRGRRQFSGKVKTEVEEEKENERKRVQQTEATDTAAEDAREGQQQMN